jgi:hypothetical protein
MRHCTPPPRPSRRFTAALVAPVLALLLLAAAPRAHAQAGIEASQLTRQSTGAVRGPEWAGDEDRPAARFRGRGLFGGPGLEPGQFTRYGLLGGSTGGARGAIEQPVRRKRPPSGAPGVVAGLVYERDGQKPVAGVIVVLASTEPEYEPERREARTDAAGYYEFADVEPGRWEVAVAPDRLAPSYAALRAGPIVTVARRARVAVPPLELARTACASGHAVWSDGYVLYDAPITVAPYDTTLFSGGAMLDGVGDFRLCGAPEDSVMVWMHLRDGRSLGHAVRLSAGGERRVEFRAEPLDRMAGVTLRVLPVLNDGRPVPRAKVTVVGRRFEQADRPALVYVREQSADADGVAEFRVPIGVYWVLVTNPREGAWGRVDRLVVDTSPDGVQPLRVELHGAATARERAAMRSTLLDHAETFLYVWGQ